MKLIRLLIAFLVCSIALALPYRARVQWYRFMSWIVHLPFKIFGRLGRFLMEATETENPYRDRKP